MLTVPTSKPGRILGFDIENMPLTYYAPDYPTAEITAIASAWSDDPKGTMLVCLLGEESVEEVLEHFVARYNEADMVTGHYIREHDLKHINGALVELGMTPLGPKLVSDTKVDLIKFKGVPKTQEFMSDTMNTRQKKYQMTQTKWRTANRLLDEGLALTAKRVKSDVIGQLQMRERMIERGLLHPPRMWRP